MKRKVARTQRKEMKWNPELKWNFGCRAFRTSNDVFDRIGRVRSFPIPLFGRCRQCWRHDDSSSNTNWTFWMALLSSNCLPPHKHAPIFFDHSYTPNWLFCTRKSIRTELAVAAHATPPVVSALVVIAFDLNAVTAVLIFPTNMCRWFVWLKIK